MTGRGGFTIVEVLLALVLLSFVLLGFQAATGQIIHYAAQGDRELVAAQLAEDRLELIRMDPEYEMLESRYRGYEASIPGVPGLSRRTLVVRTVRTEERGVLDYLRITTIVEGDGLDAPVSRTIVIASP